jgi:hypothetical protein
MTKLLDRAVAAARSLPPDAQDDIAHVVLRLTGADDEPPVPLTPDEEAAIATSKAAAANLRAISRYRRSGPNTVYEATLQPVALPKLLSQILSLSTR